MTLPFSDWKSPDRDYAELWKRETKTKRCESNEKKILFNNKISNRQLGKHFDFDDERESRANDDDSDGASDKCVVFFRVLVSSYFIITLLLLFTRQTLNMCVFLVLFFASENCKQIHLMWKKTWTSMSNGQRSSPQNVRVVWSIKNSTKTYDSNIIFLLWSLIKQSTTTNSLHFMLKLYCAQLVQCCIRWFRPANWESHKNSAANVTNDEIKCRVEKEKSTKKMNRCTVEYVCHFQFGCMYAWLLITQEDDVYGEYADMRSTRQIETRMQINIRTTNWYFCWKQ